MLNRLTVSSLIQSVIVLMSTCMMALLCVSAWNSWERLAVTSRISVVADASSNLFKAMHNLRSDRASTIRSLNDDALVQPDIGKYLRDSRDAEMPAMRAAAGVLDAVEFPDQKTLVPEFSRLIQTMTALEAEVMGCDAQAQGFAPPRHRQGIRRSHRIAARDHGQDLHPTRRGRQPQRRGDRSIADDQAGRLAAA